MTIPKITVTMLGTTKCGKSTYLLGMYATMSAGLRNYFLYTEDPDQDLDLSDAWDLLCDNGELPPPNDVDEYRDYSFVFNHGITPLLGIDWMDYRGGALSERGGNAQDVELVRARLERSDSVYLVLDGEQVGNWLAEPSKIGEVRRKTKLTQMTTLVQRAVDNRKKAKLPAPSIVVLITKADLVARNGGKVGAALKEVLKNLEQLIPLAYAEGVTTLVCPVQLGTFGPGMHQQVNVDDIDPVGMHRPLIFSLMHYLTDGVAAHEAELDRLTTAQENVRSQLAGLRNRMFGGFFYQSEIRSAEQRSDQYFEELDRRREQLTTDSDRIEMLADELSGQPIIRDGKLFL